MRVLFISHIYVVRQNQNKLKIIQDKYKIEIMIISPSQWKNILIKNYKTHERSIENLYNLDVHKPGNLKRYTYKNLYNVIKDFNPDIIHIDEEPWFRSTFQIVLISRFFLKTKPKIVIFTWENIDKSHKIHYHLMEKFTISNSDAIITGNKDAKKRILKRKAKCPVYIFPNIGVDLKDYSFTQRNFNTINVGYIGRLVPEKGIFLLLNVFNKLPYKNKRLIITGDGQLKGDIKKYIIKHKLKKYIILNPPVPHSKVPEVLQKLNILVLPSITTANWKEQFGHVLIQAMASKVAVIGSSCGAIPEVIRNAGLIFKEDNQEDLYNKMLFLIKNEKQRKVLIQRGYLRVKKNYTNEILADKTVKVYNEILK